MGFLLSKFVAMLILPPAGPLLLGLVGLCVLPRRRRLAVWCLTVALGSLWAFSLPPVAYGLSRSLQEYPALTLEQLEATTAQAVVVLGGGRSSRAAEYGGTDTVSVVSLARVRYAAKLHRDTGLPILVTGGRVYGEQRSEAGLMADVLETEFKVPVRWREEQSRNTAENASSTATLLQADDVSRILLVTSSTHMARSVRAFTSAGLHVEAAPTALIADSEPGLDARALVPQAWALRLTRIALHEHLGMAWYALRYEWFS